MNQNTKQKRSAASWLAELAKGRYGEYALSVLTALLGVACSLAPYFIIIRLTQKSRVKAEKTKIFFQKASSGFGDVSFKERSGRFKA